MHPIQQEPVLFQGSIYENIANGKADGQVTEAEVIEAAKLAQIHDFVSSLPDGYQTRCVVCLMLTLTIGLNPTDQFIS